MKSANELIEKIIFTILVKYKRISQKNILKLAYIQLSVMNKGGKSAQRHDPKSIRKVLHQMISRNELGVALDWKVGLNVEALTLEQIKSRVL